jgi:hypothetical protein
VDSDSPESLESGIVRSLKTIAKAHELVIEDGHPTLVSRDLFRL